MSEPSFDAGGFSLPLEEFELLVSEELDSLPDHIMNQLENLIFVVEENSENESGPLLGLYQGTSLTDRFDYGVGELPDRIVLYWAEHVDSCDTVEELRQQVHVTLVHEIAHYFGIDDDHLHELGWG
ncbi:MAG: putative Zn-dependent protease with MMP-like domain [Alpinimonas sp.]